MVGGLSLRGEKRLQYHLRLWPAERGDNEGMLTSWRELIGPLEVIPAESGLRDWYAKVFAQAAEQGSFALAVYGGRVAATPGLAFLAGYQAALRKLWPMAPVGLGALCATENRKLRPADMTTRASGVISGRKDFVTAGASASWLLVTAREEQEGEPIRLGLFAVQADSTGVSLEPGDPISLLPDIPHARLRLEYAAGERLAGDGWADYVKPFRTLEDIYVLAAMAAWLYGLGVQHHWPPARWCCACWLCWLVRRSWIVNRRMIPPPI